jgi:hypothetical protein
MVGDRSILERDVITETVLDVVSAGWEGSGFDNGYHLSKLALASSRACPQVAALR